MQVLNWQGFSHGLRGFRASITPAVAGRVWLPDVLFTLEVFKEALPLLMLTAGTLAASAVFAWSTEPLFVFACFLLVSLFVSSLAFVFGCVCVCV